MSFPKVRTPIRSSHARGLFDLMPRKLNVSGLIGFLALAAQLVVYGRVQHLGGDTGFQPPVWAGFRTATPI